MTKMPSFIFPNGIKAKAIILLILSFFFYWTLSRASQQLRPSSSVSSKPSRMEIVIRCYEEETDSHRVDELERACEAGTSGEASLFTDLMGDPLCRIRSYGGRAMLVAETQPEKRIVGVIRAGFKHVVRGSFAIEAPVLVPVAYVLGLRVSPLYRRMGVGLRLAQEIEELCRQAGTEYAYFATEKDNEASVNLFTQKLHYTKFRTPSILVQPVYVEPRRLNSNLEFLKLNEVDAERIYRSVSGSNEFFPDDIGKVLRSKLTKGTWLACFKEDCDGPQVVQTNCHNVSWAMLSIWACNEIFKLELRGVSWKIRAFAAITRWVGKVLPWMTIPTIPNVFQPFGLQLMYGLYCHGERGGEILQNLCWHAHNLARKEGCQVIATEVDCCDKMKAYIPHWRSISCEEDLWCIKCLKQGTKDQDWCRVPPSGSLFMDPRDF